MTDPKVKAAITNWAPRFTSQGVDYNDFIRTTSQIELWEQWLDAWCATGDIHTQLGKQAEVKGHNLSAGEAYVRAALCYHFAKFVWMVDMDQHRAAANKAVASLYAAHRMLDPKAERLEVPFEDTTMVANLRRPMNQSNPPLVFLLPGLDSTKEEFFNWENVFLARGMATLSLEGPGQGETGFNTFIHPDYEVAVSTMLDSIAERKDLALDKVGVVGVSLGGYYALRAAAFEARIKAAAAIGGPYNFGECWSRLPPITRETFIHHSGAQNDNEGRKKAHLLDLQEALPRLTQPLLVVFGKLDRLIPWQHAERVAKEAHNAELVMYPDGNHVCNNIPYKYRPLVTDWIREQLS